MRLTKGPTDELVVKLLDFGIAKTSGEHTATLTKTGAILGTPRYMAPEQVEGLIADERTDVWGVGLLLFECLAGQLPPRPKGLRALITMLKTTQLPDIRTYVDDVPAEIAEVLNRALRVDPAQRFQSAREMEAALLAAMPDEAPVWVGESEIRSGVPRAALPAPRAPVRLHRRVGVVMAIATAVVIVGGWRLVRADRSSPRPDPATASSMFVEPAPPLVVPGFTLQASSPTPRASASLSADVAPLPSPAETARPPLPRAQPRRIAPPLPPPPPRPVIRNGGRDFM